jgi:molybdenum cofactor sulfurtransferase
MQGLTKLRQTADGTEAFAQFIGAYPEYERTAALDALRAAEFSRLDRLGHTYLDYTGSGLYAESQIHRHGALLLENVFGNPHSVNPTSRLSTAAVESCRRRVLAFFNADPSEYVVVFTANASHALRLVGESYPFGPGGEFLLTFDNHNSVNGIREFARARGARTRYLPVRPPQMRADDATIDAFFDKRVSTGRTLFAYPAQSNFSGVQHPLDWIERAHAREFDVLLDAAAFVPTNTLDLSRWKPDFVTVSFYKIFGYPTGIGALVVRADALARLHRPWFAGGTIDVVSVQADRYRAAHGSTAFEDGTPDFLALPAIEIGLDVVEAAGLDQIHSRVGSLTAWTLERMTALSHDTGGRLVRIYGPPSAAARGGTIAFNLISRAGEIIDHEIVDERAAAAGISLRTGCFCNPGAGEQAFGLARREIEACLDRDADGMTYDQFRHCIHPHTAGAVRVSFGLVSNFTDVWRLVAFLETFFNR